LLNQNLTAIYQSKFSIMVESKYQTFVDSGLPFYCRKAFDFAKESHLLQQIDLAHPLFPVFFHPVAMANEAIKFGLDWQVVNAAILHDVIDLTPVGLDHIERAFEPDTFDILYEIALPEGTELNDDRFEKYLDQLTLASAEAQLVKLIDLMQTATFTGTAIPYQAADFSKYATQVISRLDKNRRIQARAMYLCDWASKQPYEIQVANYKLNQPVPTLADARA
jgi:(p)ppGpp synthase/HD superfamily hydrolase